VAAEDGRGPTDEVRGWDCCSTGAAEDGRAPTEELSCVRDGDFCSTETTREVLKEALIKYDRLSACRGFGRALLGQTADRLTACRT